MGNHINKGHQTTRGRDAGSGHFIPLEQARANPGKSVVERVPNPGYGHESSSPRGRDAGNGQFITQREAERRPATTTVENVPNRGPSKK